MSFKIKEGGTHISNLTLTITINMTFEEKYSRHELWGTVPISHHLASQTKSQPLRNTATSLPFKYTLNKRKDIFVHNRHYMKQCLQCLLKGFIVNIYVHVIFLRKLNLLKPITGVTLLLLRFCKRRQITYQFNFLE